MIETTDKVIFKRLASDVLYFLTSVSTSKDFQTDSFCFSILCAIDALKTTINAAEIERYEIFKNQRLIRYLLDIYIITLHMIENCSGPDLEHTRQLGLVLLHPFQCTGLSETLELLEEKFEVAYISATNKPLVSFIDECVEDLVVVMHKVLELAPHKRFRIMQTIRHKCTGFLVNTATLI